MQSANNAHVYDAHRHESKIVLRTSRTRLMIYVSSVQNTKIYSGDVPIPYSIVKFDDTLSARKHRPVPILRVLRSWCCCSPVHVKPTAHHFFVRGRMHPDMMTPSNVSALSALELVDISLASHPTPRSR